MDVFTESHRRNGVKVFIRHRNPERNTLTSLSSRRDSNVSSNSTEADRSERSADLGYAAAPVRLKIASLTYTTHPDNAIGFIGNLDPFHAEASGSRSIMRRWF
jgi:hypothetical protein